MNNFNRSFFITIFLLMLILSELKYSNAEVYQGIEPLDTLEDVKGKFPNAKFNKLMPAWAKEEDILYSISGLGLSGSIVVKFDDFRGIYRKIAEDQQNKNNQQDAEYYERLANQSEGSAAVSWVRWIPDYPIPVERAKSKYGKHDKSGFRDENMQRYIQWNKRGITAYLSNNGKSILWFDYWFTKSEMRSAWKVKYHYVPEFLKDSNVKKKKNN